MSPKNFRTLPWSLLVLFAIGCASGMSSNARPGSIVGTWELISYESASGADLPLGKDPIGLLVYDQRGNVSAQIMRRERQSADAPATAQPGGTVVTAGYVAYFGKYSVDWNERVVTHTIQAALSTNDVGRTLTRRFRFEGEVLVLEIGDGADARILKWRRIAE